MLLSERAARQCWCPFARVLCSAQYAMAGVNRDGSGMDPHSRCIGSECMAWRWKEDPGPQPPNAPERDDRGWCGLAVTPASVAIAKEVTANE